jgi:hypothetical protein
MKAVVSKLHKHMRLMLQVNPESKATLEQIVNPIDCDHARASQTFFSGHAAGWFGGL